MNNLNIRFAKEDELTIVQELNRQLFLHDAPYDLFLNLQWPFEKDGEAYFRDKISGKSGVCFVAEKDEEIVGYLAGGMITPYSYRTITKQSELENIVVKESERGKKIGELLFDAFRKWSKEQGAERIKVSASAQNSGAIQFYKRIGFAPYATELEFHLK